MATAVTETAQSRAYVAALRLVGRQESFVAGELAAEMSVSDGYASKLLNDLERMGLMVGTNASSGGFVEWRHA